MILLTGCVSKFSQTNYDRIVDIVVNTRDVDVICASHDVLADTITTVHKDTVYALEDSIGRNDTDIITMINTQMDEIDRFDKMLKNGSISPVYCKQKIQNINATARIIAREEGNKLNLQ